MLKKVILFTLASTLAFSAIANPHHGGKHQLKEIFAQLDLTDEQRQDLRQYMREGRQDSSTFRQDMRYLSNQLKALVHSDVWNEEAVRNIIQQRQELHVQQSLTKATKQHQVWQTLTPEQQAKFDELKQLKRADRRSKEDRKNKRFENLALTDEQQSQIDEIKAASAETRKVFKAQIKALKQAEKALIRADEFDQQAWLALQAEYKEQMQQMGLARAQSKYQIWNLLSSQQQELMEQKHQKGKRKHHHKNQI